MRYSTIAVFGALESNGTIIVAVGYDVLLFKTQLFDKPFEPFCFVDGFSRDYVFSLSDIDNATTP